MYISFWPFPFWFYYGPRVISGALRIGESCGNNGAVDGTHALFKIWSLTSSASISLFDFDGRAGTPIHDSSSSSSSEQQCACIHARTSLRAYQPRLLGQRRTQLPNGTYIYSDAINMVPIPWVWVSASPPRLAQVLCTRGTGPELKTPLFKRHLCDLISTHNYLANTEIKTFLANLILKWRDFLTYSRQECLSVFVFAILYYLPIHSIPIQARWGLHRLALSFL